MKMILRNFYKIFINNSIFYNSLVNKSYSINYMLKSIYNFLVINCKRGIFKFFIFQIFSNFHFFKNMEIWCFTP